MMMLMKMVKVEEVRRKLEQLWRLIREWSFVNLINWTFSRLLRLLNVFRMRPSAEKTFPITRDGNAPDPSSLWSPILKKSRSLPTNTAWLNFALKEGSMPEYIHPYIIGCKQGALSICFPSQNIKEDAITQVFVPDFIVGSTSNDSSSSVRQHLITSFDDVSVTLQLHGGIVVPLVRGCPYITFIFHTMVMPSFATTHKTKELTAYKACTKHRLLLENDQTWIIYSSSELFLALDSGLIKVEREYKGHVRVVLLRGGADTEEVLDEHSMTYPKGGRASLSVPFQIGYTWEKEGPSDKRLLMLSLPIHREMMVHDDKIDGKMSRSVTYDGIDGKMEAISGDSWVLKTSDISTVSWYSVCGIQDEKNKRELRTCLRQEIRELMPSPEKTVSAYRHGKFMAHVAHMAMIAEEVGQCLDVLSKAKELLRASLTAWLEGSFKGNALVYDTKWGAIIESRMSGVDAERAYDDVHYTLGYFCYAGAVLAKLDKDWGKAHRAHLYTLLADYMSEETINHKQKPLPDYAFPRLRYFDLWVLHSWGGDGLVQSEHGRRQRSSSEAVHAYYAGAMLGSAFDDREIVKLGLTLASLEIKAAQSFWHIPSSSSVYPSSFVSNNRMLQVLWANKRESLTPLRTQSSSSAVDVSNEVLLLQVYPLVPISEILFNNTAFAKELVDWASPYLRTRKDHIYALEALYQPSSGVIQKVIELKDHDEEIFKSILLWWIYSRKAAASVYTRNTNTT